MKDTSQYWVAIDDNNQVHQYSSFKEALKHTGKSVSIMTKQYYTATYLKIIEKL